MSKHSVAASLVALTALAAIWAMADELLGGGAIYELGLSIYLYPPGFMVFLVLYAVFGTLAAVATTSALQQPFADPARQRRWLDGLLAADDRRWLLYGAILAGALPALVRTYFLGSLPLTDDEAAYRFMAEVLSKGRLWADSAPIPLAFDNRFLINDGRVYAQYFLGWPALLVPASLLGVTGFMNSLLAALTVPPLYFLLRREAGSGWARVGLLLFLTSPMLLLLAATELAHTSCLCALAWFTWWLTRAGDADREIADADDDGGGDLRYHAAAAVAFCVAFWIRPLSAIGIGLPWLLLWAWEHLRPGRWRRSWRRVLAFAVPSMVFAGLFLAVNAAQNGSPFTVAYGRYLEYSRANDFRFSIWAGEPRPQDLEVAWLGPWRALAMNAAGLLRLNFALFGWVCSFLFVPFAGRSRTSLLFWASIASFFLSHAGVGNVGIDAMAPMHFVELAWPVLILTVLGLRRLTELAGRLPSPTRWRALPLATAVALTLVAWLAYVPVRAEAIDRMLENIALPYEAVERAGLVRGVVFVDDSWVPYCLHPPTRGWVFGKPNNDPDFENDLVWANHLTLDIDRAVAEWLDRPGFMLAWTPGCRATLVPLEQIPPGGYPDAQITGLDEVVVPVIP